MLCILLFVLGMIIGSFFQKQYRKTLWDAMEDHNRFLQKELDKKDKELFDITKHVSGS